MPNKQLVQFREWLKSIPEKPILTTAIVMLLLGIVVISLSLPYYINNFKDFFKEVLAEAHGMLFDLAIIGILLYWLNQNGQTRQRIRQYKDEIDDFRLWESEEAAFRTVGNLKRLNRHKIFNLNLVDTYLPKTNLNYVILRGSNLNNANLSSSNCIEIDLENTRLNRTNFENATLNQANLKGAYASGAIFKDGFLIKAQLSHSYIIKADFTNAYLMEADLSGSYLTGAIFDDANLYKADFRGAVGLSVDQFSNVKSLYLAKFDPEFMAKLTESFPELVGK